MGTTKTDHRIEADNQTLKRTRRHAEIDFLQWTDDDASLAAKLPGLKRNGRRSTLHDVTARKLADLPDTVLDRPAAGMELAIDFFAAGKVAPSEELGVLAPTEN